MRIALARLHDLVAHVLELAHESRILLRPLEGQLVGEPLVVVARGIDRGAEVHAEFEHVDGHAQDRVDDGAAAGTAGYQVNLAIFGDDDGRQRSPPVCAGWWAGVGEGVDGRVRRRGR